MSSIAQVVHTLGSSREAVGRAPELVGEGNTRASGGEVGGAVVGVGEGGGGERWRGGDENVEAVHGGASQVGVDSVDAWARARGVGVEGGGGLGGIGGDDEVVRGVAEGNAGVEDVGHVANRGSSATRVGIRSLDSILLPIGN